MNKKKRDYLIYTLVFQFVVCSVFFGTLYALKQTNSDIFYEIKNEFSSISDKNFNFINNKNNNEDTAVAETTSSSGNNTVEPISINGEENTIKADYSETTNEQNNPNTTDKNYSDNVSASLNSLNKKIISPLKNGEITSPFGERIHPIYNEEKYHAGIDIAVDTGTPIFASLSGVCEVADYDEWNGYYIKLKHENNIMTVYCHCSKLNIKKGDKVNAGDIIAYVGSTGISTGPHLHYEIRINNVSINPEIVLSDFKDEV